MHDAIIISDLHIGTYNCQSQFLVEFFGKIKDGTILTQRLIIAGDLFDSFNVRLKKEEWKILSLLRKLSNDICVVWIKGNHDSHQESSTVSHIIGSEFYPSHYIFESSGKKILVMHGDVFDTFLNAHPILTYFSDWIYWFLQVIDKSHKIAKVAKYNSKKYMHCSEIVATEAVKYASKLKCDIACCGHTHLAIEKESYYNSGSWTEIPCSYLSVKDGEVKVQYHHRNQ